MPPENPIGGRFGGSLNWTASPLLAGHLHAGICDVIQRDEPFERALFGQFTDDFLNALHLVEGVGVVLGRGNCG